MTSTRILDGLDQHLIRLMRNWAMASSGGGEHWAMTGAYEGLLGGDAYTSSMPVMMGEAQDVDACIVHLIMPDRLAVSCHWLYEGRSTVWMGRKIGCSHHTFVARCRSGHDVLQVALRVRKQRLAKVADEAKKYLTSKVVPIIVPDVV